MYENFLLFLIYLGILKVIGNYLCKYIMCVKTCKKRMYF